MVDLNIIIFCKLYKKFKIISTQLLTVLIISDITIYGE